MMGIFPTLVNFVSFSYCCHCQHILCIPAFTDLQGLSGHVVVLHILVGSL